MLFRKITSKSTGGRGNPPLQRGAEMSPPTLTLQFVRSVIQSKSRGGSKILRIRALCGGSKPPPYFIITDISPIRGITPPYRINLSPQPPICHPARSEGSPIAQNKNIRNEILRLTAQNDKRAGMETRPYGLRDKPQFYLSRTKKDGRGARPRPFSIITSQQNR